MPALSQSAAEVVDTLATLEGQIEVFLTEAEKVRRAAVVRGPGHKINEGDIDAARAWSLVTQAVNSAVSRGHARANDKPVPARSVELAEVFAGK